jgi:Fanconi anemia group M protein
MKIIIDKREKNSLIIAELVENNVDFELKQLIVADYLINEIAIERKTISDFISSMLNKRLIRQLHELKLHELKQYPKQILIIEGTDEHELYNDDDKGIHGNAIRGMLLSIVLDFQIPIIFTKNYEDTAKFLMLLKKRQEKKPKDISLNVTRKAYNIYEQQQFILEGFPGIGPSTAKKLLKHFKNLKKVINANEKQLKKAKLHENKAKTIKKIIETEYKG